MRPRLSIASRPKASSLLVRRRMQTAPRCDTQCELALRAIVHSLGLRYRVDCRLPGMRRRADLTFIRERVAVFVDGCFWHGCPRHLTWPKANADWWRDKLESNRRRDADTNRQLRRAGWKVVRVWEHEDPLRASRRVVSAVREARLRIAGRDETVVATRRRNTQRHRLA
jgi:DNA mismatch endonuclease (patch repair protein)